MHLTVSYFGMLQKVMIVHKYTFTTSNSSFNTLYKHSLCYSIQEQYVTPYRLRKCLKVRVRKNLCRPGALHSQFCHSLTCSYFTWCDLPSHRLLLSRHLGVKGTPIYPTHHVGEPLPTLLMQQALAND